MFLILAEGRAPSRPGPGAIEERALSGFVSLVGAGPGDPELLTLKAVRRLEAADLVLYDALVSGEVLVHARRAHCFHVGKRSGAPGVKQETIHRMLVDAARQGKRVAWWRRGAAPTGCPGPSRAPRAPRRALPGRRAPSAPPA